MCRRLRSTRFQGFGRYLVVVSRAGARGVATARPTSWAGFDVKIGAKAADTGGVVATRHLNLVQLPQISF